MGSVVEIFYPASHIKNMGFDKKYSVPLVIVQKGMIRHMTWVLQRERRHNRSNYYLLSMFIFAFCAITIHGWKPFLVYDEKLENADHIFSILLKLVPFYVAYAICIIPDSIFIGDGKTYLNTINSVLVNFVYYGIWFILYKTNSITFSIDVIIYMFGFGMVFHMIISFIEQWRYDKYIRRNTGIINN